mgnify:CR=1 FL=1
MNQPPAIHLLASDVAFQHARCGLVLADPRHERMTTDRARVTCRQCRRLAHLDRPTKAEGLSWEGLGE